jgi:hypothetical protein
MLLQFRSSSEGAGRPWGADETRVNKLVFIGKNLDREELTNSFKECLARWAAAHGPGLWRRRRLVPACLLSGCGHGRLHGCCSVRQPPVWAGAAALAVLRVPGVSPGGWLWPQRSMASKLELSQVAAPPCPAPQLMRRGLAAATERGSRRSRPVRRSRKKSRGRAAGMEGAPAKASESA